MPASWRNVMTPIIGQQIIVDNKGGAAGSIGLRAVANAKPDGYTLFFAVGTNVIINPQVQKGMIDTIASLAPICQIDVLPVRAGGEPQGAGQQRGRAGGAGQEGSREAHLLVVGRGRQQSPRRRAVRRGGRHPADPRALQGHRPGAGRRDQRPDHHELLVAAAGRVADQGRQPQGAGGDRQQARHVAARRADAQGTGHRRRRDQLAGPVRAGQDAGRHPRQDREGHQGRR